MPEAKPPKATKASTKKATTRKKTSKTKTKTTKKRAVKRSARAGGPGTLRVKQVRSGIGHAETYRRTLRAIGLRHYQHEITVADNPSMRGMLHKVRHLVLVSEEA